MSTDFVRTLFITLRRGLAGKPGKHRGILQALGLRVRHHCVEKPNNESIRGMLAKVPHLVIVETDKMFYLRRMRDYHEQVARTPWVLQHSTDAIQQAQQYQHQVQQEQTARPPPPRPSPPQPHRPAYIPPVLPVTVKATTPQARRPLQSVMVEPHLKEHMTPLPQGADTHYVEATGAPLSQLITPLVRRRGLLINKHGLYSEQVAEVNQQIMELRQKQVEEEEAHRQAVLTSKHTPGSHQAKVRAAGRGSRRGMLAEARQVAVAKLARRQEQQDQQQQKQVVARQQT